ncbi:MAG: ATP-binding protein [Acholeplasmataceae bacterium]|nr:ATP-binding protein [Acholeplasmataceae bacterium]
MYIDRQIESRILKIKDMFKVLLVTGPRQSGKTTTLKHLFEGDYNYVTLDDITDLEIAKNDPKLFFLNHPLPLIIDEVQLAPNLFSEIKRIVDEIEEYGQIILTGSQTFHLMQNITETLAGRVAILEFSGLSFREISGDQYSGPFIPNDDFLNSSRSSRNNIDLWETIHKGSMPELYKKGDIDWKTYYASYVRTYIERDVRSLLNVKNLDLFSRFIVSLAARTGQLVNYTNISNEVGVDVKTIQSWVKVLEASGIIAVISPFSNNALNRIVQAPMIYFLDTGLVSYLLKWYTKDTLQNGALSGAILETYAVSEIIKSFKNNGFLDIPISFYRDKDMKEIDLIVNDNGVLYPIEIKKTMNPNSSMAKNFKILHKALGFQIFNEMILCLVNKKIILKDYLVAYPIEKI